MSNNYLQIYNNIDLNEIKEEIYKFKYKLDLFQNEACYRISINENVFVTAHTGCGKTVMAIYGIAHSLKKGKKVIYTSPTKSLSNQKFKEFSELFDDVGILTGDIKVNPEADIVIMTTEILLNMLYKNNNIYEEYDCVIFDEVHYINDKDRGKVWEETLVLLPKEINLVLLSATIDNPEIIAKWIGNIKKKPINLITTKHRVVPLTYYYWDHIEENPIKIISSKKEFMNYNKIYKLNKKHKFRSTNQLLNTFVSYLNKNSLLPAIYFKFSRIKCERISTNFNLTLITMEEQKEIKLIFHSEMEKYKIYYQHLKQYKDVYKQIQTGIAYHHSGLIPILKEIIEILYSRGLIKLLLATETFAVGVNMPAKTVIFDSLQKYDNNGRRYIRTDESVQMSGRAGRRGLDKTGSVFILPTVKIPNCHEFKNILIGNSSKIYSKFQLSYLFVMKSLHNNELDITAFIKNTLFNSECSNENNNLNKLILNLNKKLTEIDFTKYPMKLKDTIVKYIYNETLLNDTFIKLSNKKMMKLIIQNKDIERNELFKETYDLMNKYNKLCIQKEKLEDNIEYNNTHIYNNVYKVCDILKEYKFITNDNKLLEKGLISIELNDCNPIIFTKLIYSGFLNNLSAPEIVAVISSFVENKCPDYKYSIDDIKISKNVIDILYYLNDTCITLQSLEDKKNIRTDSDYNLYLDFIQPAYVWASGGSLKDVYKTTCVYEGNFVRGILRINTICESLIKIAETLKNYKLIKILENVESVLIRDAVKVNSLYI